MQKKEKKDSDLVNQPKPSPPLVLNLTHPSSDTVDRSIHINAHSVLHG